MTSSSLDKIREEFGSPKNVNKVHEEKLSALERWGFAITDKVGTIGFFLIIVIWSFSWMLWNILAPLELKFDPFPDFVLWLFISNLIQINLLPLILIGQNIEAKHARLRAENDYETDKKAEREIELILSHLESQGKMVEEISAKLDVLEKKVK